VAPDVDEVEAQMLKTRIWIERTKCQDKMV
jgi:hypothetical protein